MSKKINNRRKGHGFERKMADWWRSQGFEDCKTARYESRMLDDMDIDLTHTGPFQVQLKAVEKLGVLHNVLSEMPDNDQYSLVFHKGRMKGVIVAMTLDDFGELLSMLVKNQIIKP